MAVSDKNIILVNRYKAYIEYVRPDVIPFKCEGGSLSLSHSLWMITKMLDPTFVNKSSDEAWISWIQASLFMHGIINVKHEIDITREIMSRTD